MHGYGEIFTLFFVTLGPVKLLGPFAKRTHELEDAKVRKVAWWAFAIATAAVLLGAYLGRSLLFNWQISIAAMTLAAGVIFFLVAIRQLLEQYEPPHVADPTPLPAAPYAAALKLVFPIVLTPYGIAAVIALMAASADSVRTGVIVALLVGVMSLNLLAMLFARLILVGPVMFGLQLLGAVLGVMQVALSVQVMIEGLKRLGVLA